MSCTLTQLINLLTRPLILTHPAIQITHLQLALHANLASFFGNDWISPFTLHLTAHSLPITPIYAACLASGVSWDSWVSTLSQGKEMYVFVMEGCIRVGYAGQDVVTVWKKEEEELKDSQVPKISTRYRVQPQPASLDSASDKCSSSSPGPASASALSPMTIKLQAMLDSVRNRKQRSSSVAGEPVPIQLPTLPALSPICSSDNEDEDDSMAVDVPAPIAVASAPCSPLPLPIPPRIAPTSSSDSDVESDSESDNESTTSSTSSTSSRFSSRSAESMTSVSSNGSNTAFGKPFFPTSLVGKRSTSFPSSFLSRVPLAPSEPEVPSTLIQAEEEDQPLHPNQLARRRPTPTQRKPTTASPKPAAKSDVTKYMYQGGQTGVITGGVMLGAAASGASKAKVNVASAPQSQPRAKTNVRGNGKTTPSAFQKGQSQRKEKVILGPDSCDWRRRV